MTALRLIVLALLSSLFFSVFARNASTYLVLESQSEIASPHQFPWLVSIQKLIDRIWRHNCGGSLIALRDGQTESDIVVTAAHCCGECSSMPPDLASVGRDRIVVGDHVLFDDDPDEGSFFSLASLRCHEFFRVSEEEITNDIAVVKLSSPVKFTEKIRPILLPTTKDAAAEYSGCQVAGWGLIGSGKRTNELRYANITVYDERTCSDLLKKNPYRYNSEFTLCAGKARKGLLGDVHQVACMGDSGSPLICPNEDGGHTLVGVASYGNNSFCMIEGTPDVYTKVAPYVEWIVKNAEEMTSVESEL